MCVRSTVLYYKQFDVAHAHIIIIIVAYYEIVQADIQHKTL